MDMELGTHSSRLCLCDEWAFALRANRFLQLIQLNLFLLDKRVPVPVDTQPFPTFPQWVLAS
jgi:hypothetical protein